MLSKIKEFGKKDVVRGSIILFIMINIFNFLNYLFHFFMARLLVPAQYGVIAVLMAIVYLFDIPAEGIQIIVSRYTSKFNIKREYGKIKYMLSRSMIKIFCLASLLFLIYIPICFFISYFTGIGVGLIIFTGILLFGILLFPMVKGVIQGRRKFKALGFSMIIEAALKVIISVSLVYFVYSGWKIYGAMTGVVSASLISLLISFLFISDVRKAKIIKTKIEEVFSYSSPILIVSFTVILMASLDIIFAKRFFPADLAGKYAVASMLGKMIFFGTFAISKAMFPITSEGHYKGEVEETKKIFKQAFFLVLGLCFLALLAYWLFPELVVLLLFGKQYLEISGLLIFIGFSFSFLSLSNLSLIYSLSVHKKGVSLFFLFVLIEIIILTIFHASLFEFVIGFMIANFIMFIASLIFTIKG